ncbi:hypothetical protein [Aeromicrobium chenweiae]|uniref:Uncharacterized protein n=1 Tax=Aeromicrobium chenweiae TaxID=2079793 RepID=A0A2S0WHS3_9ACTN|nr:hypothetical protein [Aeromicrobium chenweiae]AWB90780.1 hypothetical protein C3E78_00205 [Aeromicrobium chenweiae]TGN31041.1 hypothetical protein E4L97_15675 [Aeromicrobium chenweiae]
MSDTTAAAQPQDSDDPQPLDDTSGFGPEDVLGNGPVTHSTSDAEPTGQPGDPDLDADAETEPSS